MKTASILLIEPSKSVYRRMVALFSTSAVVILAVLAVPARATTLNIVIDPGPSGFVAEDITGLAFNDLDGIALNGQSESFNLIFAGGNWVATRSQSFEIGLSLDTDAGTLPGFLQGSGYALDSSYNAAGPASFGSASGSNGSMGAGVFPSATLLDPVIFYGVHFDLILPVNPSVSITGATLNLWDDSGYNPFYIDQIPAVPDDASTLLLLGLALASLALAFKLPSIARKNDIL